MASNSRKRMAVNGLPSDCWELVISKLLLNNEIDNVEEKEPRQNYLETLSFVSKQLLSITSTFVYSVKLINNIIPSSLPTIPISSIFNRFPNLTSLDLSTYRVRRADDLNALISSIPPRSFSRLTSLNLSNNPIFPALGLGSIILKNNRLTSLICSNISCLKFTDITFIADSFPLLQHLDDKNLYDISKSCPRLLQLDLEHCCHVTEKGVRLAVENCTHLREINLQCCLKVSTDIVSWMIFSRPSLRKITAPPHFRLRHCDRKLLSERCLVFLGFCKCSG